MCNERMVLLSCSVASILLLAPPIITFAASVEQVGNQPSSLSSSRHLLDVHNTPFHKLSRLLRTHSKVPEAFRNLTSGDVLQIEVNYGGNHPLEQNRHRQTQDRPVQSVNYPIHIIPFIPLRIYFIDDPIKKLIGTGSQAQDDYINYIVDTILPETSRIWGSYLGVIPIVDNLKVPSYACYGIFADYVSESVLQSGLSDSDVAVFVTMGKTLTTGDGTVLDACTTPDTMVVSTFCAVEQFGRPVIAMINYCPFDEGSQMNSTRLLQQDKEHEHRQQVEYPDLIDHWQTSPPISNGTATFDRDDVTTATIHQIGHSLAMDFDLWRYFHDINTGEPLTPPPFRPVTSTCSDFSNQIVENPASNTFVRTVSNGLVYFEIVTSRVQAVVQSHFNCPTLAGARLENDPSQQGCVAGHFNHRLFLGELMSHLSYQTRGKVSAPTLSVFEDSGWYRITYHETFLPYGQGWGCDFVNGDCIVNDKVPDYGKSVYCSTPTVVESDGTVALDKNDIHCDPLHQKWALCDLFNKSQVPTGFLNSKKKSTKSWFSDSRLVSATDGFDSCPLPILTLQVDCNDSSTSLGKHYQGEAYGTSSRCINAELAATKRKLPACFKVTCDADKFQVKVNGITCKYDGEVHTMKTVDGHNATFECPRISLVCPELFCPSDCTGRGMCDYTKKPPECSCANNATTPNCQFLDDSTLAPITSPTPAPGIGLRQAVKNQGSSAGSDIHPSILSMLLWFAASATSLLCWKSL